MPRRQRADEFPDFVRARRVELLRTACLLTAGDSHVAGDLVQIALARLPASPRSSMGIWLS